MAGRTPAEAFEDYREHAQRAVSCVSDAVLLARTDARSGAVQSLVLSPNLAPVRGMLVGWLTVWLHGRLVQTAEPEGAWTVDLTEYAQVVRDHDQRELFAYHWHPFGQSPVKTPHLHVGSYPGLSHAVSAAHFPTGVVPLSQVIRLLITDFSVQPRRRDWARILQ